MAKKIVDEESKTDRTIEASDLLATRDGTGKFSSKAPGRSLGYKKDVHDERDFKARALLGARRTIANEALDLQGCVSGVKDQGATSSCVGQSIGTAIDTRLRKLGKWDAPLSSSQAIYTFGRALSRLSKDESLQDGGTFPRNAMKGLKDWGVPTEQRWPFDPSHINDELPWDVMQAASANCLQAWWRIDSMGKERVEDICQALEKGYPVVFGTDIDQAFMDHSGTKPVGTPDRSKIVGGHMMCLVGYTTENSARVLRGVNSWGIGWGDRGFYWATEGFIMDPAAGDFYVIQAG